ncbi:hypothetical protein [Oceanobacillus sp. J11TS1]|uniref:hypothetical protein n=1 Tax=Oceanobacillus sp. J11TS1 TaxID=2807191 RepID=UPI001B20F410|nr:hypothetical protein [Oceanobacillus sp. J11TS1]GIO24326.1 hypothetical protein J11TS1_29070 [Oceanobacillus sp. J11TS1]
MKITYKYFYTASYLSIIVGLISLLLLNINLLFQTMFSINFSLQGLGILLGIIGLFNSHSRTPGVWGIVLNIFSVIFIIVVTFISLTINYQP